MAKHRPLEAEVEDGSWFLEAVGAKQTAPPASESLAELEHENTHTEVAPNPLERAQGSGQSATTVDSWGIDGHPGTSTSSFDDIPELPSAPVDLFERSTTAAPEMVDLAPPLNTKRRFRWPFIGFVVFLVAIVGATIVVAPNVQESQALAVRQSNYDAALAVRSHLPGSQVALDAITSPTSSDSEVAEAPPVISSLSNRGVTLAAAASDPLPFDLPFFQPASMDSLDIFVEQSAFLGADASEIARRLNRGYVYRTSIPKLLNTDDLPTTATANEVSALAVTLASSLASDASVIADLPSDPAFQPTLDLVATTNASYTQWQDDYLAALNTEDTESAQRLISDLDVMRLGLAESTRTDLLAFRTDIDSRIVDLAGALDNHLENLSR